MNAQWAACYADAQARLQSVYEQNEALTRANEELKAAQEKLHAEHQAALEGLNAALGKANAELEECKSQLEAKAQEASDFHEESDRALEKAENERDHALRDALDDNNDLRTQIDVMRRALYARDCYIDELYGSLCASRDMVRFLQSRAESQRVAAAEQNLPKHKCKSNKTVRFLDEQETPAASDDEATDVAHTSDPAIGEESEESEIDTCEHNDALFDGHVVECIESAERAEPDGCQLNGGELDGCEPVVGHSDGCVPDGDKRDDADDLLV